MVRMEETMVISEEEKEVDLKEMTENKAMKEIKVE